MFITLANTSLEKLLCLDNKLQKKIIKKIPSDRIFLIYQGTFPESLRYLSQKT